MNLTKFTLQVLCGLVLLSMLVVTTWASLNENVLAGGAKILAEPWGIATLFDTYFAFLTFYAWVYYKETGFWSRGLWLILILALGNIAMAAYLLGQLAKVDSRFMAQELLLRKKV